MFARLLVAALIGVFASTAVAQGGQDSRTAAERAAGSDLFMAGGSVRTGKPVGGDLFAAGGNVDVGHAVDGDAIVAGGNVRIGAPVAQSVYAVGGQLFTNSTVGRNVRIAGGDVELGPRTQVAGNVSVAGGQVTIEGRINGYLHAGGGSIVINGPVDGDVVSTAGSLALGPNARIGGKLRYASRDALRQHPAAQALGGIEVMPFEVTATDGRSQQRTLGSAGWLWTIGLVLIAAALSLALPEASRRVAETLLDRPVLSLLLGFVALVCIPAAALVLLITVIGIPLALLALLLYLALLLVGYISAGIGAGHWALRRFSPTHSAHQAWRIGAAASGMLAIALLGRLPWLGGLIVFAALIAGIGALTLQLRRRPQPV